MHVDEGFHPTFMSRLTLYLGGFYHLRQEMRMSLAPETRTQNHRELALDEIHDRLRAFR